MNNDEQRTIDINAAILPRFERDVVMGLSDDAEAKERGETEKLTVKFVIQAGWSVNDLVDRLLTIVTSPRVAYQNANRGKAVKPSVYEVPKAHTRVVIDRKAAFKDILKAALAAGVDISDEDKLNEFLSNL